MFTTIFLLIGITLGLAGAQMAALPFMILSCATIGRCKG
jgi:hypothetical protein